MKPVFVLFFLPEGDLKPTIKVGNRKRVYDNLVFSCVCTYDFGVRFFFPLLFYDIQRSIGKNLPPRV